MASDNKGDNCDLQISDNDRVQVSLEIKEERFEIIDIKEEPIQYFENVESEAQFTFDPLRTCEQPRTLDNLPRKCRCVLCEHSYASLENVVHIEEQDEMELYKSEQSMCEDTFELSHSPNFDGEQTNHYTKSLINSNHLHSDDELFKCNNKECLRTFKTGNALVLHMRTHTLPFKCIKSGCIKSFRNKRELSEHAKRVHGISKLFKCKDSGCSKSFRKGKYNVHMRVHTGERPFKCTYFGA